MEHKYPVRTFGISYICDDCGDMAVEYKEFLVKDITNKEYGYRHICPKCGKEYIFEIKYPYSIFEPIIEIEEDEKWWSIFKRK